MSFFDTVESLLDKTLDTAAGIYKLRNEEELAEIEYQSALINSAEKTAVNNSVGVSPSQNNIVNGVNNSTLLLVGGAIILMLIARG